MTVGQMTSRANDCRANDHRAKDIRAITGHRCLCKKKIIDNASVNTHVCVQACLKVTTYCDRQTSEVTVTCPE